MNWPDDLLASATAPLPPWTPPPERQRRGCRIRRRDLEGYWRPEPREADLSERDLLYIIARGEMPPEPPPPEGWADWPRSPQDAAVRLAEDWYEIVDGSAQEDPMTGDIIVTGYALAAS